VTGLDVAVMLAHVAREYVSRRAVLLVRACLVLAVVALVAACCSGCGASAATQGAYALEQARCLANERDIVDRQGTTLEEDQASLAAERARCDAALDAIEEAD
jgi:hypothetical protein